MKKLSKKIRRASGRLYRDCRHQLALIAVSLLWSANEMVAKADGPGGFGSAVHTIQGYEAEVSALMKAIAAVICLVGAFNVYFKMQNGDQDVKKTIMLTIGGAIAFVALSEMLPEFFK